MSDLLLYATTFENNRLRDAKTAADIASSQVSIGFNYSSGSSPGPVDSPGGNLYPTNMTDAWTRYITPLATEAAQRPNGFVVCDTSGYFRCGCNCDWTVPAGVTSIRVQMWNPGGGTASVCCCGGSPFGPSGSFALWDMDVTPGDNVVFCAGCANCCYATQTTAGNQSASYVCHCGTGKVTGATPISDVCCWNGDITTANYWTTNCNFQLPSQLCGPTFCSGWNYCFDTQNDSTCVTWAFSKCTTTFSNISGTNVRLIPGIWPSHNVSQQNSGTIAISPPVFGFLNLSEQLIFTTASCAPCFFKGCCGKLAGPGFGGYAGYVNGGCNACGGDSARMGMICVSWC